MDLQNLKEKLSKLQAENWVRKSRLQQLLVKSHQRNKDTCTSTWVLPHPPEVPLPVPTDHKSPVPCHPVQQCKQQAFRASPTYGQQKLLPPIPQRDLCLRMPTPPTTLSTSQATNSGQVRSRLPHCKRTESLNVASAVTEQNSAESLVGKTEEVREQKVKKKRESKAKQRRVTQQAKELPVLAKLPPLPYPEQALLQAVWMLSSSDWEKRVEGLTSIRSLAQHHAELLLPRLHDVCLAVTREVKNLRSVVSCAAMVTLADLYAHLRRGMDAEADGTARVLLHKAGEANKFIRENADLALGYMVLSVNPTRSMNALISTGLRHRNACVRKSTAQHLGKLAEVIGLPRLLSGKKDFTDRFIHAISCLALDSAQEVRMDARRTLGFLAGHPDLLKMVDQFVPAEDKVTIKEIIIKKMPVQKFTSQ